MYPLIAQINADVSILIQRARFILNKLNTIPTPSLAFGHPTPMPVADIINITGKRAQIRIMGSVAHIPTLLGASSCQLMTFEFFIFFLR